MPVRCALAAIAVLLVLSTCPAHARPRVLISGSGGTVVVAVGDSVYRATVEDDLEPLLDLGRSAITALAAGPSGLFVAAGRALYGGNLDGSNMRPMGTAPHSITALAEANGLLLAAADDVIYRMPVHSDARPVVHARAPGEIRAMHAAADGIYVAIGKNLWRLRDGERDQVAEAPSPIVAVAGGSRNIYYAYRRGGRIELATPGSDDPWILQGPREIDAMWFDTAGNAVRYTWSDKRGPHVGVQKLAP